jgi:hypothetical protein
MKKGDTTLFGNRIAENNRNTEWTVKYFRLEPGCYGTEDCWEARITILNTCSDLSCWLKGSVIISVVHKLPCGRVVHLVGRLVHGSHVVWGENMQSMHWNSVFLCYSCLHRQRQPEHMTITISSRVILKRLIVSQLAKKLIFLHGTRRLLTVFTRAATGSCSEPDEFSSRRFH